MKFFECFWGQSGTGKSTAVASLIMQHYQKTGQKTLVWVGDGSSATYEPLVDAGLVDMTDYSARDWPFSTTKRMAEGFIPEDLQDPTSPMRPMTEAERARYAMFVFEGMSVASTYVMGSRKGGISDRGAKGEKIAGDSPIQILDVEREASGMPKKGSGTGEAFGGVTLGGYGVVQRHMLQVLEASKALPGWVIWTGHERTAEDKITGQKVVGPELAGSAMTASLSRVFNNTLHFSTAERTVKKTDAHTQKSVDELDVEYRIYVKDHFRPEGGTYTKYKAVARHPDPNGNLYGGSPTDDALPLYFESDKPGESILQFYAHIAKAQARQKAFLQKT